MTVDYLSVVADEAAKIVAAYERDPKSSVPWSDRWTIGTVARHVAGTHHVVAEIVRSRPDADFGLFSTLETPDKGAPEFAEWFRSGTTELVEQLKSVPPDEECWSWYPAGRTVGWWARRMAFETVIHRWDADAALQQEFSVPPEVAADGIDEYLDVFVASSRSGNNSPAGPTISFECTDRDDRWWLDLGTQGERTVYTEPRDAAVGLRGPAEQLLLVVWGRVAAASAPGVETVGDPAVLDRWSELVPPV